MKITFIVQRTVCTWRSLSTSRFFGLFYLSISQFDSFSWNPFTQRTILIRKGWVVEDDDDPTGLKYSNNTRTTRGRIRTANVALYQLDHVRLNLRIGETLAGKSLANQRSIRQIRQCFPPPTFRTIR